ncbi:MAG: branched-chain amino acid ABC transporter permease [Proteobacteria bacterium]|nr:branched-chain amino acid ABC transporter permease [Pseudomonadota bacterium]
MPIGVNQWVMALILGIFAIAPIIVTLIDKPFYIDLIIRIMILSIAAISLNLLLGIGNMVSFGHAAYIGLGAYAIGIPAYYEVYGAFQQLVITVLFSGLFALLTGIICLRTKGLQFIMITLAFSQMIFFAFVSIEEYGGDDGLLIDTRSDFGSLINLDNDITLYYLVFAFLVGTLFIMHRLIHSRFGMVIRGTKSNEARMQALGFNTYRYQLICYVIAGMICGLAGWLLGNFTGFISPEMMSWTRSGELIFMVVLGGAGTLFGPVLGTVAFVILEEILSGITIYWPIMFGLILIFIVLFAKGGLEGLMQKFNKKTE